VGGDGLPPSDSSISFADRRAVAHRRPLYMAVGYVFLVLPIVTMIASFLPRRGSSAAYWARLGASMVGKRSRRTLLEALRNSSSLAAGPKRGLCPVLSRRLFDQSLQLWGSAPLGVDGLPLC